MAPHFSTLAWRIPWMEEPGRLQSMGSLRVGHNWMTSLSLFSFMHWKRKWQLTPVFLPGGRIPGIGEPGGLPSMGSQQSWTLLKWLSSSSSRIFYKNNHNFCNQRQKLSGESFNSSFPVFMLWFSLLISVLARASRNIDYNYLALDLRRTLFNASLKKTEEFS